jgi:hypothetical protein
MSARKRKAPDRKNKPVKQPGILWQAVVGAGRLAARQPRGLAGGVCAAVAFSFVAANALWYQPGGHPHPFFQTRDPEDPNAIAGYRPADRGVPGDVTTFHIERQNEVPAVLPVRPAEQPAPTAIELPQSTAATSGAPRAASQPFVDPLIAQPDDEKTAAAVTPVPPVVPKVVPTQRPTGKLAAEDPVAAAIRASERPVPQRAPADRGAVQAASAPRPAVVPPADVPSDTPVNARATRADQVAVRPTNVSAGSTVDLVMQIQRGLVNIAYTDVTIDGVAGAQTRAAIRHFQKHYRLPENGEPSEIVLRKLRSIGAL